MNILLSSTGRKTYMIRYFKDALNNSGKVFASNEVMTYSLTQADGYLITPQIYDDSYILVLIDYCKANQINYIIPLSDSDLLILARNKEKFLEHQISVIVSDEQSIEICNDKWKTYQLLSSLGLPQPKTYIDLELVRQEIKSGNLTFPLILKPRWSTESMGVIEVDTMDELNIFYPRVYHDIQQSHLCDVSQEEKNTCVIIQEKISGDEYILEIFHDLKGSYITTIVKHKMMWKGNEILKAKIVDHKRFEEIVKVITSHLKFVAAIEVYCFITRSGELMVIEMDGHWGASYSFAHLAGIDFPKQMVEWFNGSSTTDDYFSFELGVIGCGNQLPAILCNF